MPDKKTVDEIDDSVNDLAAMLPGYLSRREEDLKQIELFFIESNYKEIARIAHKIKGTGTGFGLPELTKASDDLEEAAKSENDDDIRRLIGAIFSILDQKRRSILAKSD